MKSKFINVLMFAAGAAIGSAVTWKIVKDKYEQIVQEELESIRETFGDLTSDTQEQLDESDGEDEVRSECSGQINWDELEDLDEDEEAFDEQDLDEYARLTGNYSNEKGGVKAMEKEPYVISPYDFGEIDGYNQFELTYYEGDDTLEDEDYNIITDRDALIGPKALFTFGEYEDDSVFVRNERLSTDFQILKDYRTYTEARSVNPARVDNE